MDRIDAILGMDETDPIDNLAKEQAEADRGLFARLRSLREDRRGLTQRQIAERMGVDQGTVARIESGRRDIHMSTLRLYALALHARIDHEIVDVEDPLTGLPRVEEASVLESNLDRLLRRELGPRSSAEHLYFVATSWDGLPTPGHARVPVKGTIDA